MHVQDNGMEWNFSNTIRRGQTQDPVSPTTTTTTTTTASDDRDETSSRDTRRHTLTETTNDDDDGPIRMEIEDTAFVAIGDRSSIVIGETSAGVGDDEVMGGNDRKGGEGGVLQEPERTQGDGQEDERLDTPPSNALQHTILPLLAQVMNHVICHVIIM